MVSFEHKKLIELIAGMSPCPEDEREFEVWRSGLGHVNMLRRNAAEQDELVVLALAGTVFGRANAFVHSAAVKADHPGLSDHEGLLKWSCSPFFQSAATVGVVTRGGEVSFEPREHRWGTDSLVGGSPLVYGRSWDALDEPEGTYYEIAQPYIHHLDVHWRKERSAYCRFDRRGDWEDVVSITKKSSDDEVTLISFKRDPLDQYLVEHDSVLVRLFDFTFLRSDRRGSWRGSKRIRHEMEGGVAFSQQFAGDGSMSAIRGVQIVQPRLSREDVEHRIKNWHQVNPEPPDPVEFIIWDFRQRRITTLTTDPTTTTDYFSAAENSLPFDTSPAFFRAEVLLKYKGDSEKYTVLEHRITCRGGWELRSYSVNEAGQVAAYICDLRNLPHEEQLHWAGFNERPKAGLSDRAFTTDFLGRWPETMTSCEKLLDILDRWRHLDIRWWNWRPDDSPDRLIVVPRTGSRNEWAQAIGGLSNGVNEGFAVKELRRILAGEGVEADNQWGSIVLLEKILHARGGLEQGSQLAALRELNRGRRFSGVHARGSQARKYVTAVLTQHETYTTHFEHLCEQLARDSTLIENYLTDSASPQ